MERSSLFASSLATNNFLRSSRWDGTESSLINRVSSTVVELSFSSFERQNCWNLFTGREGMKQLSRSGYAQRVFRSWERERTLFRRSVTRECSLLLTEGRGRIKKSDYQISTHKARFTRCNARSIVEREREKERGGGRKEKKEEKNSGVRTCVFDNVNWRRSPPAGGEPRFLIILTRADDDSKSKHLSS